jgi:uncharacterized protein (DUF1810 family)
MTVPNDPHNLDRFIQAQEHDYQRALNELKFGQKSTHWMWFIFPQFEGLGWSSTSRWFAIKTLAEAEAFLAHPVLGKRLIECCEAMLSHENHTANSILGSPDDHKLRSSATLFAHVSPSGSIFHQILDKYFDNQPDNPPPSNRHNLNDQPWCPWRGQYKQEHKGWHCEAIKHRQFQPLAK